MLAPQAVTLDIDDTCDVAHGHQQLSLFNANYDDRCSLPIHVYDTATGRPVAVILRPGKTPSGKEVARPSAPDHPSHPHTLAHTKITIRGDSHYGRREVMDWCEDNGLDYVFGLSGNKLLAAAVEVQADDIRTRRALEQAPVLRGYTGVVGDPRDAAVVASLDMPAEDLFPRRPKGFAGSTGLAIICYRRAFPGLAAV